MTNAYKCTGKTLPFLTHGFNQIWQTHVIFDSPGKYIDGANANATPMNVGRFITPSHLTSPFHHIFGVGHGNLSGSSSTNWLKLMEKIHHGTDSYDSDCEPWNIMKQTKLKSFMEVFR